MMNLGRLTLGFFVHSGRKKMLFFWLGMEAERYQT